MLTERQKQAVHLMCVDGLSIQDTATALGVHRTTVYRWSREKGWMKEWEKQRRAAVREWEKRSGSKKRHRKDNSYLGILAKAMDCAIASGNAAAMHRACDALCKSAYRELDEVLRSL